MAFLDIQVENVNGLKPVFAGGDGKGGIGRDHRSDGIGVSDGDGIVRRPHFLDFVAAACPEETATTATSPRQNIKHSMHQSRPAPGQLDQ